MAACQELCPCQRCQGIKKMRPDTVRKHTKCYGYAGDEKIGNMGCGDDTSDFLKSLHHNGRGRPLYNGTSTTQLQAVTMLLNSYSKFPGCHQKTTQTQGLRAAQQGDMSAVIRSRVSQSAFLLELLPALLDIIQPSLRPVNSQLFSAKEKQQMAELIHTMIAYNLTYQQERTPEGQYQYLLEPNMEEAVRFSEQQPRKQLTYAAKQLIAKEIEVEKMRRSEALLMSRNRNQPTPEEAQKGPKSGTAADAAVPNHLAKLQPKKITVSDEKPAMDFFGRVIKKKTPERMKDASGSNSSTRQQANSSGMGTIYYKFNEGFSNAIRKNVPIQDLL